MKMQNLLKKQHNQKQKYIARCSLVFFAFLCVFALSCGSSVYATTTISTDLVTITATVPGTSTPPSSGGGGGGGGYTIPTTVTFSGKAYPWSKISLLQDGQVILSTISGGDAKFLMSASNLVQGTYTFSITGTDSSGSTSTLFTVTVYVSTGTTTDVSGIFLAPTIDVDKTEVKQGDTLTIFGHTIPESAVTISVHSDTEHFYTTNTDANGAYVYKLDTSFLEMGTHATKAKTITTNDISSYGKLITFTVGSTNQDKNEKCIIADVNCDSKVNLIDFSILSYWYKRIAPPIKVDLNKDGKVNLTDFSIMAYYWTG